MTTVTRSAIAVLCALALVGFASVAPAGTPTSNADADALQILKKMTDYVGGLEKFSMHTENSYEDVLDSGQKIQVDFASSVVIQRPDKLRAERVDGDVSQVLVYDGETLSVYQGAQDFFAVIAAPDNLDDALDFSRDALDLVPPAGDMVYTNAYELLTAGLTSGFVVGQGRHRRRRLHPARLHHAGGRLAGLGRRRRQAATGEIRPDHPGRPGAAAVHCADQQLEHRSDDPRRIVRPQGAGDGDRDRVRPYRHRDGRVSGGVRHTMNKLLKTVVVAVGLAAFFLFDLGSLGLVPEAEAVAGVRRRTARRTAVVVSSADAAAGFLRKRPGRSRPAGGRRAPAPQSNRLRRPSNRPPRGGCTGACADADDHGVARRMRDDGQVYQCGDIMYKPYLQGTTVVYAQVPGP